MKKYLCTFLTFLLFFSFLIIKIVVAKEDTVGVVDKNDINKIYEKIRSSDIKIEFFGTEYSPNQEAIIWLQLLRNYQPINDATCYITAYYPNKTIFLNNTLMFYLINSDGLYYYDLITPDVTGVCMLSARCNIPSDAFSDDFLDYSKLESYANITTVGGKVLLLGLPLELPNYKGVEPTANMTGNVLLYHLNEQSGMIIDYSGEGNNGTNYEASYGAEGKINTALWFNGANSVVGVVESNSWKPTDAVTVEAWVKFDEIKDVVGTIVGGYSSATGYFLAVNPYANTVYFYLNGVYYYYVVYGQGFSVDTWYHIAGTYNRYGGANNHKIYVNGQIIGQRTSSGAIGNYNQLRIGSVYGTYRFGQGTIDEVAIFNRSLSTSEISDHYNRGVGIYVTDGYIKSIPLTLNGSSWLNYSSNYNLKDGNIDFKILDNSNNVLCSSLGDISSCANTNSPIKLYAQLTRPNNTSVSPEIDSWFVKWNMPALEEIRGSGEMHISDVISNTAIDSISDDVIIKMLQNARILNERVVNFHNSQYCIDNSTLQHNITYNYCVGSNCKLMQDIMDEACSFGCDSELQECKKAPYLNALVVGSGIVGFLILLFALLKLTGRI
jgi:hypothetical protein